MVSQKFIKLFENLNFNVIFIRDYDKWFVYTTEPWFIRGHEFLGGACVGVFALNHSLGSMNSWAGFRDSNYDK